jgi:hypothetical protein
MSENNDLTLDVNFFITDVDVTSSTGAKAGKRETEEERVIRMKALLNSAEYKMLIPVGKLLARRHNSRTLAEHIVDGATIPLKTITIQGKSYPLAEGFAINLQAAKDAPQATPWLCPACTSAHGSGIRPSPGVSAKGLASNDWYYNPATKLLFVISDTCFDTYVRRAGFGKRIAMPKLVPEPSK